MGRPTTQSGLLVGAVIGAGTLSALSQDEVAGLVGIVMPLDGLADAGWGAGLRASVQCGLGRGRRVETAMAPVQTRRRTRGDLADGDDEARCGLHEA